MTTWMVVEDEPDIYEVLKAMFEIWGIEGIAFIDGGEALAWIDAVDAGEFSGELPELAILDIRLPNASGPEISARLRQSPSLDNIGVSLITAYRLSPQREREVMKDSGADLLLYKPLPVMQELRTRLDEIIAARRKG